MPIEVTVLPLQSCVICTLSSEEVWSQGLSLLDQLEPACGEPVPFLSMYASLALLSLSLCYSCCACCSESR